ncbi:Nipped-B-like protein, partial [Trichinella pseudospiralis]
LTNDNAVAVRTKAMKCLAAAVEIDPEVLSRTIVQKNVLKKVLDQSSNMREAAVDLIGKLLNLRPDLLEQYYSVLTERLLDTGVSVRKRTIRILKEVCERRPDFDKIPEICSRILKRTNDEESIVKLICETFNSIWLTPTRDHDPEAIMNKVVAIIDVVSIFAREGGQFQPIETLLKALLKDVQEESSTSLAARQIMRCLVEHVLVIEEKLVESNNSNSYQRFLWCLSTICVFSKVEPRLMIPYIETMQPYLSMSCSNSGEQSVMTQVIKIIELVVPLIEHPSPKFLKQLEDGLCKLMSKAQQNIVQASISCLSVILEITKHTEVLHDVFFKCLKILATGKDEMSLTPNKTAASVTTRKPLLTRSLFTCGALFRYFDFDVIIQTENKNKEPWKEQAFQLLLAFTRHREEDLKRKAFVSIGLFCVHYSDYLLRTELKELYQNILTDPESEINVRTQVLRNLESFLNEEERKMLNSYATWETSRKVENLKEMGETTSGLSSSVIQCYLPGVLNCYFNVDQTVRTVASEVVLLTLQQGLVHPGQHVKHGGVEAENQQHANDRHLVVGTAESGGGGGADRGQAEQAGRQQVERQFLLSRVEQVVERAGQGVVQIYRAEEQTGQRQAGAQYQQQSSESFVEAGERVHQFPDRLVHGVVEEQVASRVAERRKPAHLQRPEDQLGDADGDQRQASHGQDQAFGLVDGRRLCIPCVVAMTTDPYAEIRVKAEKILKEIDGRYGGFLQIKALEGIRQSYRLQSILQPAVASSSGLVRGFRDQDTCDALNSALYTILRNSRQQRRALLRSMLQLFDEIGKTSLNELVYVADNLANFPYHTLEEPLFVIHNIDLLVSVNGSNLLQNFKEYLLPLPQLDDDEEEEETLEQIMSRLPVDLKPLKECIDASQGCYLKDAFSISDSKLQEFSLSEPSKQYQKGATRRNVGPFKPRYAIQYLKRETTGSTSSANDAHMLCKLYMDFKQLMMSFDISSTAEDTNLTSGTVDRMSSSEDSIPFSDDFCDRRSDSSAHADSSFASSNNGDQQQRIVLTIHRLDANKMKNDNIYADMIRPAKAPTSAFAVSMGPKGGAHSSSGKRKKFSSSAMISPKKLKKRKRVIISDSDLEDNSSDENDEEQQTLLLQHQQEQQQQQQLLQEQHQLLLQQQQQQQQQLLLQQQQQQLQQLQHLQHLQQQQQQLQQLQQLQLQLHQQQQQQQQQQQHYKQQYQH